MQYSGRIPIIIIEGFFSSFTAIAGRLVFVFLLRPTCSHHSLVFSLGSLSGMCFVSRNFRSLRFLGFLSGTTVSLLFLGGSLGRLLVWQSPNGHFLYQKLNVHPPLYPDHQASKALRCLADFPGCRCIHLPRTWSL